MTTKQDGHAVNDLTTEADIGQALANTGLKPGQGSQGRHERGRPTAGAAAVRIEVPQRHNAV